MVVGMNPDVDTSFLPDREREEEERKLRYVTQSATSNLRAGFIQGLPIHLYQNIYGYRCFFPKSSPRGKIIETDRL